MVAGLFGMFFLGALYLQRVLGYDPIGDRPGVPAGRGRLIGARVARLADR